jgi:hypothetical protein
MKNYNFYKGQKVVLKSTVTNEDLSDHVIDVLKGELLIVNNPSIDDSPRHMTMDDYCDVASSYSKFIWPIEKRLLRPIRKKDYEKGI